jgi:hypothetical protein
MFYIVSSFVAGALWAAYLQNIYKKTNNLDKLKNALLTLSLVKLKAKDFSDSCEYSKYSSIFSIYDEKM